MCSEDMMTPGAGGHLRAEEAVGAGEGGQGHQQHLQALRSQETPENIQGDRDNYKVHNVHMLTWKFKVGEIYLMVNQSISFIFASKTYRT